MEDLKRSCHGRKGTYLVLYELDDAARLTVGRKGTVDLGPGIFIYVGSALGPGGLWARLRRHLSVPKKARWHIDFLHPPARPVEVWVKEAKKPLECSWASLVRESEGCVVPLRGFGSSDCRCKAHLFAFPERPLLEPLRLKLDATIYHVPKKDPR